MNDPGSKFKNLLAYKLYLVAKGDVEVEKELENLISKAKVLESLPELLEAAREGKFRVNHGCTEFHRKDDLPNEYRYFEEEGFYRMYMVQIKTIANTTLGVRRGNLFGTTSL